MPTSAYFSKDGTPLPGTTTIIGRFKDSGGLLQWACRVGYEQGLAKQRMNLYAKRDVAADVGTYVHALIEWHINGEEGPEPDPPKGMSPHDAARGENGYEQFVKWEKRTQLYIVSWEKPLISERWRFGGTPDSLFEFENMVDLGDWKSATGVYPDNLLQLAAYKLLWEENFPDQPIHGAHIVRFSKDFSDVEHWTFGDLTVETRQFLRLREAWEDDKLIRARV
jgi:hypothetical protein